MSETSPSEKRIGPEHTVLYVIDTLATGGAEKSLLEISSRLENFRPVVCVVFSKNGDLRQSFMEKGIELIELDVSSSFWWYRGARKLRKVISRIKPDIVHATLFKAEIVSRLACLGTKVPLLGSFVNDSYAPERFRSVGCLLFVKIKIVQWIDRITARSVDHFIAITNSIVSTNSKALNIPVQKISVVNRGRDPKQFDSIGSDEMTALRQMFRQSPVFLTVGRLLNRKGYPESIAAFSKFLEYYPSAIYLIAGEGHDRKHFEKLISDLNIAGNVLLLGNRSDIAGLLTLADVFIFPSHYEGQGGALIEAMFFGKPIIATRIPVIEEQVQHNHSARLFDLKNSDQLFEQMIWMMRNPEHRVQLGKNARQIAMERFDIARIAAEHENIYLSVIRATNM